MVTKDQAVNASYRELFHYGECKKVIGPKGGVKVHIVQVRVNGKCQTWKTRPEEFKLPYSYGLYDHGYITHYNAMEFHREKDCPLNEPDPVDQSNGELCKG